MAFGERLQELRRRNGLTQEEFAAQLQVSRQAVSKWESCRGYPEIEKIIYICNRYGVRMDELFSEEIPQQVEVPAETPPLREKPLSIAVSAFLANRSPYSKTVVSVLLAIIVFLLPACLLLSGGAKGGADNLMTVIWTGAIIVFGIAEAMTAGLVSIWFVAGSVAALIASSLGAELLTQFLLFLCVSVLTLALTRPLARKMLKKGIVPTNADRVLHGTAKVTETVDNENAVGAVYVEGKTWSARSANGTVIPENTLVEIIQIEGVTLIVREKQ